MHTDVISRALVTALCNIPTLYTLSNEQVKFVDELAALSPTILMLSPPPLNTRKPSGVLGSGAGANGKMRFSTAQQRCKCFVFFRVCSESLGLVTLTDPSLTMHLAVSRLKHSVGKWARSWAVAHREKSLYRVLHSCDQRRVGVGEMKKLHRRRAARTSKRGLSSFSDLLRCMYLGFRIPRRPGFLLCLVGAVGGAPSNWPTSLATRVQRSSSR